MFSPEEYGMGTRTRILYDSAIPSHDAERRGICRNPCHWTACCRSITGPPNVTWRAAVWDASVGGLGLTLPVPFEPGTVLAVNLDLGDGQPPFTKLLIVRHLRPQPDEGWTVGGFFVHPLSRQQMEALS